MCFRIGFGFTAIFVFVGAASAQMQGIPSARQQLQQMQQMRQLQSMQIEGTLEGMTRGRILVLDDKEQQWQVVIPQMAEVHVIGSAEAGCLQNGMLVEFTGEIDDHVALKDKVGALKVIAPSPNNQPGLYPPEMEGEKDAKDDGEVAKDEESAVEQGEKKPQKKTARRSGGRASAKVPAGTYRIVGRLVIGRGDKVSVHAGRNTIALELAEQPEVTVDVSDYSLASLGDKVSVRGVMKTGQPGFAQANEVTIELATPLASDMKKNAASKSEPKRPSKKSESDEAMPEPPGQD